MAPLFGFLHHNFTTLRSAFERDVDHRLADSRLPGLVGEAHLAPLPPPVQRYLRLAGVVGQPHVHNLFARMHGRIRSGPGGRWMPLEAQQFNFTDPPARCFFLTASMHGLPVQGYHRYTGASASMAIRAASVFPVANASGAVMTQSETVTLLNDMCVLAPAVLVTPSITWAAVDRHAARATLVNAGCRVSAELVFNDDGELVDFVSEDRHEIGAGGQPCRRRWRTPLSDYRAFGSVRLASRGAAIWGPPGDEYAYIELTFDEVRHNVRTRLGRIGSAR